MDDLISRQDAIDAFAKLIPYVIDDYYAKAYTDGLSAGYSVICQLPSAQPEQSEILRCKDCRHNKDCDIQYHAQAGEEFYCGAAERRTDE